MLLNIKDAMHKLKYGTAPGDDSVHAEMLKAEEQQTQTISIASSSKCLWFCSVQDLLKMLSPLFKFCMFLCNQCAIFCFHREALSLSLVAL